MKSYLFWLGLYLVLVGCSVNKQDDMSSIFKLYKGDVPGVAVMLINSGRIMIDTTFGLADLENKISVTRNTNFRLASVTKQFTAMCVMILKARGALDFSTTLDKVFPEFPDYGRKITIRHLLQHTSGLVDYEDLISDTATVQVLDVDVLRMMMSQDTTYFKPGSSYRYSNSGYAVLAMIIEKISGKSFADFLNDEIFAPLEMNNTLAYEKGKSEVPDRAFGYTVKGDTIEFSDQSLTSAVLGDGGIYSSITDLYKWDQALYTEKLISRDLLQQAFTPHLETYGYGWRIDRFRGRLRVHHTGSTSGFRNVIQRFPEEHVAIIILSNRNAPGVAPLAEKLFDWYITKEYK